MDANNLSVEPAIKEVEKQITIICRGMTTCVDRLPYGAIQKADIYFRIALAMLQASQCEMSDAIHIASASTISASPNNNNLNTRGRRE